MQNGLTGTIEKISPDREFTVLIDGQDRKVTFTPDQYRYVDLGYAVTIHKSQGQTTKDVILMADARAEHMNTTENFYVAMSRAEQSGRIYTNDASALKEQYKIGQEKTSTIAKAYDQKKERAL